MDNTENAAPPVCQPPARLLPILGISAGVTTLLVGLGMFLIGMGFANVSASGTGTAAIFVGIWTVLATRNLRRNRPGTLVCLAVAWMWMVVRFVWDSTGTVSTLVVVLFALPAISIPLAMGWIAASVAFGVGLTRRLYRLRGKLKWSAENRASFVAPTLKFAALFFLAVWIPYGLSAQRGQTIDRLAREYAPGTNVAGVARSGSNSTEFGKAPVKGTCTSVFLGYQLTDLRTGGDRAKLEAFYSNRIADAKADLAASVKAGARYIRVGASGDHLLVPHPDQERVDDEFMAAVRATGLKTVFVDTQHPQICKKRRLSWNEFCGFQRDRISYYMKRYEPDVYYVVCEPLTYHAFTLTRETKPSTNDWTVQLEQMCKLVKSIRPATRTAICLLVQPDRDLEWEVWNRLKTLPELDIVGVEIYEPEQFAQTEERLRRYGHPKASGKSFWIAETYNGWALASARDWNQDAAWLKVTSDFGRKVEAESLLVWTFNSFLPGGCFISFEPGKLARQWAANPTLSVVGQAFEKLP